MIKDHVQTCGRVQGARNTYTKKRPGGQKKFADWIFYYKFQLADRRIAVLSHPCLAHNDITAMRGPYHHWLIPIDEIPDLDPALKEQRRISNVDEKGYIKFLDLLGKLLSVRLEKLQNLTHDPVNSAEVESLLEGNGWLKQAEYMADLMINQEVAAGNLPPFDQWDEYSKKCKISRATAAARKIADAQLREDFFKLRDVMQEDFLKLREEFSKLAARVDDSITRAELIASQVAALREELPQLLRSVRPTPPAAPVLPKAQPGGPAARPRGKAVNLETTEVLGEAIGDMAAFQDNHLK